MTALAADRVGWTEALRVPPRFTENLVDLEDAVHPTVFRSISGRGLLVWSQSSSTLPGRTLGPGAHWKGSPQ